MRALASISAVSSLILAACVSVSTARSETNRPAAVTLHPPVIASSDTNDPVLPRATTEILQLTQAGVDEDVVLAYIGNSSKFHLTADQIVFLTESGVAGRIVQAMLARDRTDPVSVTQATNNAGLLRPQANADPVSDQTTSPASAAFNETLVATVEAKAPATTATLTSEAGLLKPTSPPSAKINQPAKRKIVYPVREPYPVELTSPIVLLDTPTF